MALSPTRAQAVLRVMGMATSPQPPSTSPCTPNLSQGGQLLVFFLAHPVTESNGAAPHLLCWTGASSGGDGIALDADFAKTLGWPEGIQVRVAVAALPGTHPP